MLYYTTTIKGITVKSTIESISEYIQRIIAHDIKNFIQADVSYFIRVTNTNSYVVIEYCYSYNRVFKTTLVSADDNGYKSVEIKETDKKCPPIVINDYRKVSESLIIRLIKVSTRDMCTVSIAGATALLGADSLPEGYVLQQEINKTVDPNKFDEALGRKYLNDSLDSKLMDLMYDREGYRLYHTLNMLDTITREHLSNDDTVVTMIANNAFTTFFKDSVVLSTTSNDFACIDKLFKGVAVIPTAVYYKIHTLLSIHLLDLK